jgi:oligopeptide/dipeptide ABC transporter ATP-binding protein
MTTEVAAPLLDVRGLVQRYDVRDGRGRSATVQAVSDVSFQIARGETLSVVGETGCGKSSLARSILQSPRPKAGSVAFNGLELTTLRGRDLLAARRGMQVVFQDPFSSLDPRWTVTRILDEPLAATAVDDRAARRRRRDEVLTMVGLDPDVVATRKPGELSGGQSQRVAIARALTVAPSFLICDEAVSSLDVIVQAQILQLFATLRREMNLAYLFISHDLSVVRMISDRIAIMYLGKLCEIGPAAEIFARPRHPYTAALLGSLRLHGEPASALAPPSGCRFRTRCPRAEGRCATEEPVPAEIAPGHVIECHFPLDAEPSPKVRTPHGS